MRLAARRVGFEFLAQFRALFPDAARFFDEETALWARVIQEKNVTAK